MLLPTRLLIQSGPSTVDCRDRVIAVRDLIKLDTTGLHGQRFDWRNYGGALALLRLSQFVRTEILKDAEPPSPVIPIPRKVYMQQNDLILMTVDEIPADAVRVELERPPDGGLPLGGGHVLYSAGTSK
ncbi:MAG: hypothetical protein QOJ64_2564 [Acidobacteriota bacterium]|jgi:hypothetical protein|nr:hypothetical protein [Acidobacteriota bacterium]